MYFTNEEIKKELLENWEQIEGNPYPLDMVREFADGYSPVYYNDILKDWAEMPSEFNDRWQEFTPDANGKTIFSLMSIDLWVYYLEQAETVYNEIKAEKEANE